MVFFFVVYQLFSTDPTISRVSNIESNNSQNGGLEDYNNISDRIFPYFTTPFYKDNLRVEGIEILSNFNALLKQSALS